LEPDYERCVLAGKGQVTLWYNARRLRSEPCLHGDRGGRSVRTKTISLMVKKP
jgi:hypothetical protein